MKQAEKLAPGIKHIPYGSKLHQLVIKNFKGRLDLARDEQRKTREEEWKNSEDTYTAYMPETDVDRLRKEKRKGGETEYTTINIPYSYAMLLTAHTYYTSVFLARDPIFQLKGRHGESQTAETAMESLLDYQLQAGGGMPALFVWLMDIGKYSHGVLGHYWDKEEFTMTKMVDQPKMFLGMPIPGTSEKVQVSETITGFEGNRLYNVRPADFLTDPRVPLFRFQEGEFCIVFDKVGWVKIAAKAASGRYYNLKALKEFGNQGESSGRSSSTGHDTNLPGEDLSFYNFESDTPSTADLYEFHWDVIPSELGIGSSNRPEKWVFTIANKSVIVSAQPLGLAHNKYPFDVIPFEVEGYNVFNRSMLEVLDPLNKTMEWLFNSHFYNVRAALNNMFLVDPSKVNVRDLEEPGPGKMIRLKPAAYGQDVRTMLSQFQVQDITRSNLSDSETVAQLAQRITGVSDNVMGSVNAGGRKTATEVRSSTSFGINRLKTNCEWFSNVGFGPLANKLYMSSQQLYTGDKKFRIIGDQAMWSERYMQVTPDLIAGMYDFVPVDGTMPVDRFAQANLWQQMLGGLSKVPGALEQYDLGKIFAFVAQLGGLKNINKFRINVVPDGMMQQQAQMGNAVPMRANLNEPGQIPGMGASG
jgi:hypothetical protein